MIRAIYLVTSITLVCVATLGVVTVINFSYTPAVIEIKSTTPEPNNTPLAEATQEKDARVIHENNAFDKLRGDEVFTPATLTKVKIRSNADFDFEVRGIHILGDKRMALISTIPLRKSGKRPSGSSTKPRLISVGEDIEASGYILTAIEPGNVSIERNGETNKYDFTIASSASLRRANAAHKKTQILIPVNKRATPKPLRKKQAPSLK